MKKMFRNGIGVISLALVFALPMIADEVSSTGGGGGQNLKALTIRSILFKSL